MQPRLHALLIGIDNYSFAPLNGCVNDVNAFKTWLEKTYPAGNPNLILNLIGTLLNEQASRAGIIAAFDKFQPEDGDFCLLFYSGHGSRSAAPEAFWTETDKLNESLVCYDSRSGGGQDLIDKELAWLIWKVTADRKLNFIVITDCCHSGTITRAIDGYARNRSAVPDDTPRNLEDYLGYGTPFYKSSFVDGKQRITPQIAPHFHLAASRDSQTAKELDIDDTIHGAFTHSLLRALYETHGRINYGELDSKIKIYVQALTNDQTPSVSVNNLPDSSRARIFLDTKLRDSSPVFSLSYGQKFDRWELNAGSLQGISIKDQVIFGDQTLPIIKSYADYSLLSTGDLSILSTQQYPVTISRHPESRYRFRFTAGSDTASIGLLKSLQAMGTTSFIEWVQDAPDYIVDAPKNTWSLYLPSGEKPLFDPVADDPAAYHSGETAAHLFLFCLEKICRWRFLLDLENPDHQLQRNTDFDIAFLQLKDPGRYEDTDKAIPLQEGAPAEFFYREAQGKWYAPAIRIRVASKPHSRAPRLYINAVILQWDYAIITAFDQLELTPGDSACLRIFDEDGYSTETLMLEIPSELLSAGFNSVKDYLKVFISTQPLDMARFTQEGLSITRKAIAAAPAVITRPDWVTWTSSIETIHQGSG
ncbi:MAG TPA: caspase family protein [Puia sp.]|nr:caspase family protein [Puia sp.]